MYFVFWHVSHSHLQLEIMKYSHVYFDWDSRAVIEKACVLVCVPDMCIVMKWRVPDKIAQCVAIATTRKKKKDRNQGASLKVISGSLPLKPEVLMANAILLMCIINSNFHVYIVHVLVLCWTAGILWQCTFARPHPPPTLQKKKKIAYLESHQGLWRISGLLPQHKSMFMSGQIL